MLDAHTRLKNARALMLVKHPFFASIMMGMPMIISDDIPCAPGCTPTMATDMKSLYVAPSFVDTIDDKVLLFAIAHEIMHTALEHGSRLGYRDMMQWNIACDYSINLTLKDTGFTIWDRALSDEQYRNDDKLPMSADAIYNLLPPEQKQQGGGGGGGDGDGADGQSPGSGGMGQPGGQHHSPMLGDIIRPEAMGDPVAEDALRHDIQQRVAQAANVARMMGELSASLERFVNEVLDPKVPWTEMLRQFMQRTVHEAEESWARRNRRFPIYLPSRYTQRMGEIILIDDTSGSIGNEQLKQYNGEAAEIAETVNPERIRIVYCDAKVKGEQEWEMGEFDPAEVKPVGGGGTRMDIALAHVEQYEPTVVVLFTDGATPWGDEPDYPLIVCCTTEAKCPIGEVIRI
jgi:predicted metal-dependent peptidase